MNDFDPSQKAQEGYRASGMSRGQYITLRERWRKSQWQAEGNQGLPKFDYVPRGYNKVYSMRSAEPNKTYWKPEAAARLGSLDMPWAVNRANLPQQTYWDNPVKVGMWKDYLDLQPDDYEPPDWLDKDALNALYKELKSYNDGSTDYHRWKPLPFGSQANYVMQFLQAPPGTSPNQEPLYTRTTTLYKQRLPTTMNNLFAAAEQFDAAQQELKNKESLSYQDYLRLQGPVKDYNVTMAELKEISPELYEQFGGEIDFSKPLTEKEFNTLRESAGQQLPDYSLLEKWAQFQLALTSAGEMKNRPDWTRAPAIGIQSVMAGAGTAFIASTALAPVAGALAVPTGGVSLVALPIVANTLGFAAGLAVFYEATFGVEIPGMHKIQSALNWFDEQTERVLGMSAMTGSNIDIQRMSDGSFVNTRTGETVLEPGQKLDQEAITKIKAITGEGKFDIQSYEDFRAAWQASSLYYEAGGFNAGDWMTDAVSKTAYTLNQLGIGKDWSSGYKTQAGQVWQLANGLDTPQNVDYWGPKALSIIQEQLLSLGKDATKDQVNSVLAVWRDKYGYSGNMNDFLGQMLISPSNYVPMAWDALIAKVSPAFVDGLSTKSMEAFKADDFAKAQYYKQQAMIWDNAADLAKAAIGNPITDAMPMGVQSLFEKFMTSKKLGDLVGKIVGDPSISAGWQAHWRGTVSPYNVFAQANAIANTWGFSDIGDANPHIPIMDASGAEVTRVTVDWDYSFKNPQSGDMLLKADDGTEYYINKKTEAINRVMRNGAEVVQTDPLKINLLSELKAHSVDFVRRMDIDTSLKEFRDSVQSAKTAKLPAFFKDTKLGKYLISLSLYTPESLVKHDLRNLQEALVNVLNFTNGDRKQAMAVFEALGKGTDVEAVSEMAKRFQGGSIWAQTAALFKEYVKQGGNFDEFKMLMEGASEKTVLFNSLARKLNIDPLEMRKMEPADVLNRLRAVDPEFANMTEITRIEDIMRPFTRKTNPVPLTDTEWLTKLMLDFMNKTEEGLVKYYGVEKMAHITRFSKILKNALSLQVITLNIPTWITNLLTNEVSIDLLIGKGTIERNSKIDAYFKELGIDASEIAGKDFGITGEILANAKVIYDTLHPKGAAGVNAIRGMQGFIKKLGPLGDAYGNIESFARKRGAFAAARDFVNGMTLSKIPAETRAAMEATMTPDQIRAFEHGANGALNQKQLEALFGQEITYHPLTEDSIKAGIDAVVGQNEIMRGAFEDLLTRTDMMDFLRERLMTVETPEQLEALRLEWVDRPMRYIHATLADDATLKVTNISENPEGLVRLLDINQEHGDTLYYLMHENNVQLGEAMARADEYRAQGRPDLADLTVQNAKESAHKTFQAFYSYGSAIVDAAIKKAGGGEYADRMAILMREQYLSDRKYYIDREDLLMKRYDERGKMTKADYARAANALTDDWRTRQSENFRQQADIWVELAGKKGAAVNGLKGKSLETAARKFMDSVIDMRNHLRMELDSHYSQPRSPGERATFYTDVYQPLVIRLRDKYTQDYYDKFFVKGRETEAAPENVVAAPRIAAEARNNRVAAWLARTEAARDAERAAGNMDDAARRAIGEEQLGLPFDFTPAEAPRPLELRDLTLALTNGTLNETQLLEAIRSVFAARDDGTLAGDGLETTLDALDKYIDEHMPPVEGELEPITDYPLASTEEGMPHAMSMLELVQHPLSNTMNAIFDEFKNRMGQQSEIKFTLPGELATSPKMKGLLKQWESDVRLRSSAAIDYAKIMVDNALLNYSERTGADQLLEHIYPFHFWTTRSMGEWAKRVISNPKVAISYAKWKSLVEKNALKVPSRFEGKLRIYLPWLPKEYGSAIYINPLDKMFPLSALTQPLANISDLSGEMQDQIINRINYMVRTELVSKEDGLAAIQTGKGAVWESASADVLATNPDVIDPMSAVSWSMMPAPWFTIPYYFIKGEKDKIKSFPMRRMGKALSGVGESVGGIGGGILDMVGTILSFPEDMLRKAAGLHEYDIGSDFYIDRWLSNMAADGSYDTDTIMKAMIEKQGPAWDEAKRRADEELSYRLPGSLLARAISTGDVQAISGAMMLTLFPAGIYPEGELKQRGLAEKYKQAWIDLALGDNEAITRFYDEYPEYEARLALFKTPEERLRANLINSFWEKYYETPDANRQMITEQLGEAFEKYFLDPDTRDYEMIDVDTLAYWNRQIGNIVPETEQTESARTRTLQPLDLYNEDVTTAAQAFIDERKKLFPNYYWQSNLYYKLPEDKRKEYVENYKEYKDYLDWKKKYIADNPIVGDWLEDRSARFESDELLQGAGDVNEMDANAMLQLDGEMLSSVGLYILTRTPLPDGVKAELNRLWSYYGKPGGSLETWIDAYLGVQSNE